jgi:K+-transporting ATPase KdpF subunit
VNAMYWLGGIVALAVFVYLVVALFRPELFS